MSRLMRVRVMAEGGGLVDWNSFERPEGFTTVYDVARRALKDYDADCREAKVEPPAAIVLLVEPIPEPVDG